jgi:molybdenum cofactor cytidylyltransferase
MTGLIERPAGASERSTYRHQTDIFNILYTFSSSFRHRRGHARLGAMAAATDLLGGDGPVAGTPVALVLAAGAGSRFRGPGHKLDARLRGRPVLERAVDNALTAGIGPVVVVTGAPLTTALHPSVVHVVNSHWAEGQATSLRAGLAAAADLEADAVLVGLGDQPFVGPSAWRRVAGLDAPIVVATYRGRRGHPVRLHRSTWSLLPRDGDEGARAVIGSRPDLVTELPCEGSPIDIDTVEDLRRWQSSSSTSSP